MGDLNDKELKILNILRGNSRESLTRISRLTHIPISTIYEHINSDELKSVIRKFTCLMDFQKLGYAVRGTILMKAENEVKEELKRFLECSECVNSAYRVNNGFDFMADVVFRDMSEMQLFLERLEQRFKLIERKEFFVIEEMKREGFCAGAAARGMLEAKPLKL